MDECQPLFYGHSHGAVVQGGLLLGVFINSIYNVLMERTSKAGAYTRSLQSSSGGPCGSRRSRQSST